MNSSGLVMEGSGIDIANFSDLAAVSQTSINGVPYGIGPNAQVENPQVSPDPSPTVYTDSSGNKYYYDVDVFVSYGTYNYQTSYHTIEFACQYFKAGQTSNNCAASTGWDISSNLLGSNTTDISNPGGMSLLSGGPPYTLFAAVENSKSSNHWSPRYLWWDNTTTYHRNYP